VTGLPDARKFWQQTNGFIQLGEHAMKKATLFAIFTATAFSLPALAVEEHHEPGKQPAGKQAAPAKPAPVTKGAKAPAAKDSGMPMGMMQDRMLKMHEQMHKIMLAKDPKERDKLMQEHMQMMQEQMKMMGGMMGNGMMGPGMMGGDGKGGTMGVPAGAKTK
jgi:hypothetical protein